MFKVVASSFKRRKIFQKTLTPPRKQIYNSAIENFIERKAETAV